MNLAKINLNLLVALDALLSEQHVTKAAKKVFITQSAMSIALAQLRELLQDEILVRTPQGMTPTPRAEELRPQLRKLLEEIKTVIYAPQEFDPATSTKIFKIGMSDYSEVVVLPRLMRKLAKTAPNVAIKIFHLSSLDKTETFMNEQLDLGIGILFAKNSFLETESIFTEASVCVARKDHPLMQKPLTLKNYLQAKHIALTLPQAPMLTRVDRALQELGVKRDIAISLPHIMAAFYLVRYTDYLFTSVKSIADEVAKPYGLVVQEVPFKINCVDMLMAWPKQYITDPAHLWLRDFIRSLLIH